MTHEPDMAVSHAPGLNALCIILMLLNYVNRVVLSRGWEVCLSRPLGTSSPPGRL